MIDDRRVIAVVPARGGSKGVPGKNLREVGGVSLLHRTLRAATASRHVDLVVVSSDDNAILEHASLIEGVIMLRRPADLAGDDTAMAPVVEHALNAHPADIVVLLQPTSPLRETVDIEGALERFVSSGAHSLISVCPTATSPYWMYLLGEDGRLLPILRKPDVATRQELPPTYQVNGAVYVVESRWFREHRVFSDNETIAYVMPGERSIDVDSETDLIVAEALLAQREPAAPPSDK
jgi:CMP-N,N'-diacetyllegionaminic acid synthase